MKVLLVVLFAVLLVAMCAHLIAARLFLRRIQAVYDSLAAMPVPVRRDDLPALVEAFARRGMNGARALRGSTELVQTVAFRMKRGGPFTTMAARQIIANARPGFVWIAESRAGPLLKFRVIDSLTEERGQLEARLFGSIPVARAAGAEADIGEAMRYLAELPWAPDAIWGNPALDWHVVAPSEVEVRLAIEGEGTAVVRFGFNSEGDIETMSAKGRPAETGPDGRAVRRDWQGRFGDYGVVGARRLPRSGEVGYVYDSGYEAYFRGRIAAKEQP